MKTLVFVLIASLSTLAIANDSINNLEVTTQEISMDGNYIFTSGYKCTLNADNKFSGDCSAGAAVRSAFQTCINTGCKVCDLKSIRTNSEGSVIASVSNSLVTIKGLNCTK